MSARRSAPDTADPAGVAFGALLAVLAAYHQFKLPPVLPVLTDQYGHDPRLAGGFMSVYALAGLILSPLLGRLIERDGATRYLHLSFALLGVGGVLALARPSSGIAMLASRALEGSGFAVLAILAPVLVTGNAGQRHLAVAVGLFAMWIPTGQLIANFAARPVLADGGWTPLWWGGLAATAAMALWARRRAASGRLDLTRRGATTAPAKGGATPHGARIRLWTAAALFCLWSTQFIAYMTWLPSYLVSVHGLDPSTAVLGYTVPIVTLMGFNLLTGWLMTRGLSVGPLLAAALAGQALIWLALPVTGGGWIGIASLIGYGIGAGIVPTCLFALPNTIEGTGRPGAFATLMTGRNLGVLAGPLLLAWIVSATADWNSIGPVFAATTGVATLLAAALARALPGRADEAPSAR